jgi:ribosomal protein L35AE/L33A
MKNIIRFIMALTIVLVAAITYSGIASAAQVTRINKNKGHIYINEGKEAGFIIGASVCFFSDSGEILVCGKIRRTTPSYAVVKIDNRSAKKIKNGMKAQLHTIEEKKGKIPDKSY